MVKRFPISQRQNSLLAAALIMANVCAWFIIPLVLLPKSLAWGLLLIPIALLANTTWALLHESIHQILLSKKRDNDRLGRLLSLCLGVQFHHVQYTHLRHHAYSRTAFDRVEVYEPAYENKQWASFKYYIHILQGFYLKEVFSPLLYFLPRTYLGKYINVKGAEPPRLSKIKSRMLLSINHLKSIRLDTIINYVLILLAFLSYGSAAWMFILFFLARGLFISIADNAPHYGTPLNQVRYAYNLSMPPILSRFFLNFNYHAVHHQWPHIPWQALPAISQENKECFEANYLWRWFLQLKGPIDKRQLVND